jgi:hypothetical protein
MPVEYQAKDQKIAAFGSSYSAVPLPRALMKIFKNADITRQCRPVSGVEHE